MRCSQKLQKFTKTTFLGVQGCLESSMLANLKSSSLVLVVICSKSVSICNRFHTIRASRSKLKFLRRYPSLTPSFEENPLTQGHEILSLKTRVLVAAHSKDFAILACIVLMQITSVTDRRTCRHRHAQTMAKTSEEFCCRA